MTPTLRAYLRKSVVQDDTDSPARQRAAIERWAGGRYRLEWYDDIDISGRYEANRPGWQQLLADLGQPGDAGVIVETISRSHRNTKEFLTFHDDHLEPRGLTLISATENIDLSTTQGRMIATILMSVAENEAREASDRMRRHIQHLIKNKGRHFGPIPFGCQRDPDTCHLIPAQTTYLHHPPTGNAQPGHDPPPGWELRYYHDTLRTAYELYASGQRSYQDTADLLNAGGWRFWKRDRLTPVRVNRQQVRKMTDLWQLLAGELPTGPAGHDPILPPALCRQVGAAKRRRTRGAPGNRNRGRHIYLLTGCLRCGRCGQPLIGQHNPLSKPHRSYRHAYGKANCPEKTAAAEKLEQEVLERLAVPLTNRELLLKTARIIIEELAQPADNNDLVRLAQKREAHSRLVDLYTDGLIDKGEFIHRRETLAAEIDQLELAAGERVELPADLEEAIIESLASLEAVWDASREDKRTLILDMIERVEVMDKKISRFVPAADVAYLFSECELKPALNHLLQT